MSVSSDLFTIGRTLAVLAFNFDFAGEYRYRLPNPTDVPLLAEQDSFHRLLCRQPTQTRGAGSPRLRRWSSR